MTIFVIHGFLIRATGPVVLSVWNNGLKLTIPVDSCHPRFHLPWPLPAPVLFDYSVLPAIPSTLCTVSAATYHLCPNVVHPRTSRRRLDALLSSILVAAKGGPG